MTVCWARTETVVGPVPRVPDQDPQTPELAEPERLMAAKYEHPGSMVHDGRPLREAANRYEWPCPGDLLRMDTSEYARFQRPGHRVTGDRSTQQRQQRDGVEFVHAIVDDHTRLAYAEIHPDQQAATAAAFLERALALLRRTRHHR